MPNTKYIVYIDEQVTKAVVAINHCQVYYWPDNGPIDEVNCCFANYGTNVYVSKDVNLNVYCDLANEYVEEPSEFIKVHQHVKVKVLSIDVERKRIGLSLKDV